jgi:hypothetical protein
MPWDFSGWSRMMCPVTSPEERLYEAVAGWMGGLSGPEGLIDAGCTALVDGLDSPALRDLAGASPKDRLADVTGLAETALDELRVPWPGTVPPGYRVAGGGGVVRRSGTDTLRLEVVPTFDGFEVRVHVNGVDITREGAGRGVEPSDLLVPDIRLAVGGAVTIARCTCDLYSCSWTDITVIRDGDLVHWEWPDDAWMRQGVTFTAADYDTELTRLTTDRSWQTVKRRRWWSRRGDGRFS